MLVVFENGWQGRKNTPKGHSVPSEVRKISGDLSGGSLGLVLCGSAGLLTVLALGDDGVDLWRGHGRG